MSIDGRVTELEQLVVQLGSMVFGDLPGHAFHGNQHQAVEAVREARARQREVDDTYPEGHPERIRAEDEVHRAETKLAHARAA